jgi:hypothetical protein
MSIAWSSLAIRTHLVTLGCRIANRKFKNKVLKQPELEDEALYTHCMGKKYRVFGGL